MIAILANALRSILTIAILVFMFVYFVLTAAEMPYAKRDITTLDVITSDEDFRPRPAPRRDQYRALLHRPGGP